MLETTELTQRSQNWLCGLSGRIVGFLESLRNDPQNPARYLPCVVGVSDAGLQMSLGSCCFAVKTLYTLGEWELAEPSFQAAHIDLIQSFQLTRSSHGMPSGTFVDWPVWRAVHRRESWTKRIRRFVRDRIDKNRSPSTPVERLGWAETKQAWATLVQIGARPKQEFAGLPQSIDGLQRWLARLDWREPWGAGGQFSCLATLLSLAADTDQRLGASWKSRMLNVLQPLADPLTGAYFAGPRPEQGQLVNGAMKVLTALTWLDQPIHFPERLIDTCLRKFPEASGCHLVDAAYVLHRCLSQTDYRRDDARLYADRILSVLEQHHLRDGGFSYHTGKSQTSYYGARIAQGLAESDLHATCLLTWTIALCEQILGTTPILGWKVIKP